MIYEIKYHKDKLYTYRCDQLICRQNAVSTEYTPKNKLQRSKDG